MNKTFHIRLSWRSLAKGMDSAMSPILVNVLNCVELWIKNCWNVFNWHLNVRIGEYIGVLPFTKKQIKPKSSSVADHLLFCNHSVSHDFGILTCDNKKFLQELKESLLITRNKPSLNRNIPLSLLYLFNWP